MNKTNLKKSLVALMLVAAGSIATSANAYEFLNGYGKGLSQNALTTNALTSNALTANGLTGNGWQNGYQYNGGGANGLRLNGGGENGWINGFQLNGREMNGREMNGFIANGHKVTPGAGRAVETPEGESKLPRLERSASPLPEPMISSRRLAE